MPTPDEYRKIAETYYRLAREAKTEADRLALLDLAKSWLEAARARQLLRLSRRDFASSREAAHLAGYRGRWSLRKRE